MTRRAHVRVPATSANLGAGFDCIAVAVDQWLSIVAWIDDRAPTSTLDRSGTLAELQVATDDDLIVKGFDGACTAAGRPWPRGLHIRATSTIPVARGLGSSAAALVGGAIAANVLLDLELPDSVIVNICATIERHADNVAAAVYGGATLVLWPHLPHGSYVAPLRVSPSLAFAVASPSFSTKTADARALLPGFLSHNVATRAVALSAALVSGLATADGTLLAEALEDVVHVPFRRSLVRGFDDVTRAARAAGAFGATLSGSGSSIVAIAPVARAESVAGSMRDAWIAGGTNAVAFVSASTVPGATGTLQ
jgi:homoserine kinase